MILNSDDPILCERINLRIGMYIYGFNLKIKWYWLQIYYIVGAQQLEGYGQECFLAKDDAGHEVLLAPSLIGNYIFCDDCEG